MTNLRGTISEIPLSGKMWGTDDSVLPTITVRQNNGIGFLPRALSHYNFYQTFVCALQLAHCFSWRILLHFMVYSSPTYYILGDTNVNSRGLCIVLPSSGRSIYPRSCCFSSRLRPLSLHWTGQISAQTVTERSKSSLGPEKLNVIGRKTLYRGSKYIGLVELSRDLTFWTL